MSECPGGGVVASTASVRLRDVGGKKNKKLVILDTYKDNEVDLRGREMKYTYEIRQKQ